MNQRIKVSKSEAKDILAATFPEYTGRKISVEFSETVSFYDMNWSGGTCNKYAAITVDGKVSRPNVPAPWVNPYEGQRVNLPVDAAIVEHSYFCGKDCGITIYLNPVNAPKWITA